MGPLKKQAGVLIAEAIIASFLMLFAFAASTQLFEASLRWESDSTNVRLAAIVAERRMEDIRQWASANRNTLPAGWANLPSALPASYPDASGFEITQEQSLPIHTANGNRMPGEETAPAGFFSPASHLYFPPPAQPALPALGVSAQKHPEWGTYPHPRNFDDSLRQIKVIVKYGTGGSQEFVLISVVGDRVSRDPQPQIVISGPSSLSAGEVADYSVAVNRGGNPVPNVTALWSVAPESPSTLITALNPSASQVRVPRGNIPPGTSLTLAVKIRYAGKEYVGLSSPIFCP